MILCLESLQLCREKLRGEYDLEIIYVDSDSTDDSIVNAINAEIDKVIRISGEINSAVARNVGARNASNDWFLFVDGDMEIRPEFFREELTRRFFQEETFFSGQFINVWYNSEWKELERETFTPNPSIKYDPAPGGLFIVKAEVWNGLGGMKDHYKRSQDFEFGLRCYKAGFIFKRINSLLATHHTISYLNFKRNLTFFKGNNYLYSRSMLYRDHIFKSFNKNGFKILIRQDYSLLVLAASIILAPFLGIKSFLFYLVVILFRSLKNRKQGVLFYFIYIILRDVSVLLGLFFFHPKKNLEYEEEIVIS